MWLKSLELTGWQKHDHLKIDFINGVNIIYGDSDAGKSCIRRAIAWLFGMQEFSQEDIRKEGTKKTSVKGTLDDGTSLERIRSASINRYILQMPGQDALTYDAIGRDLPEEIQDVLKMKCIEIDKINLNLNIDEQVTLPFLIGDNFPASARMKLFNKLTGNDLLDVITQNFNKEIINIRRSITAEQNIIDTNTPVIEKLEECIRSKKITTDFVMERLKNINDYYRKVEILKDIQVNIVAKRMAIKSYQHDLEAIKLGDETKLVVLRAQIASLVVLNTLKEGLNRVVSQLDGTKGDLSRIKAPSLDFDVIRSKIERFLTIKSITEGIKDIKDDLSSVLGVLKGVKEPKLDPLACRLKVEKRQVLRKLRDDFNVNTANRNTVFSQERELKNLIPKQDKEYNDLLKEAKICPTCKRDTKDCEVHL